MYKLTEGLLSSGPPTALEYYQQPDWLHVYLLIDSDWKYMSFYNVAHDLVT